MSNRIKPLPQHLANQIAAGEVIERPASVLKELIENSIDAGASHIDIDIENGGMGLIRVRDNGCGIVKEDLALAVLRHATSKIQQTNDLFAIETLGFRGEALASMSSISKMKISSHAQGELQAWELNITQDLSDEPVPCSHPVGTSITLRDLFYNIPARRKFLKSAKTEWYHLYEVFKRFVLSHPNVGFVIKHNGKRHKLFAKVDTIANLAGRIKSICNAGFLVHSHYIEMQYENMILKGWVGLLPATRRYADQQYFFLNHRTVKDKLISHAIKQAYHQSFSNLEGLYPSYVLFLEVAAENIDVNVHPTKHEVRFQQSTMVHDFIEKCIKDVLQQYPATNDNKIPGFGVGEEISTETGEISWSQGGEPQSKAPQQREPQSVSTASIGLSVPRYANQSTSYQSASPQYAHKPIPELLYQKEDRTPDAEILTRYYLIELSQELVIVDLESAKSRILEKYIIQSDARDLQVPLLMPHVINSVPPIVIAEQEGLKKMGFMFQVYEESIVVTHIPFFMSLDNLPGVLEQGENIKDIYIIASIISLEKIPKTKLNSILKKWIESEDVGPWLRVNKADVGKSLPHCV